METQHPDTFSPDGAAVLRHDVPRSDARAARPAIATTRDR
jgi:hypothetical protein